MGSYDHCITMLFAQGVGWLFNWNFNSNPDCSDLGLSLLQWLYDKDGYPTHTPLDDYRNERWDFFFCENHKNFTILAKAKAHL